MTKFHYIASILLILLLIISMIFIFIHRHYAKIINFLEIITDNLFDKYLADFYIEDATKVQSFVLFTNKIVKNIITYTSKTAKFVEHSISEINKNYSVFSITSIFIFIFVIITSFYSIPSLSFSTQIITHLVNSFPNNVKIIQYLMDHNETLMTIIKVINGSVGLLFSISLTLFYFTYRQRKTISISSSNIIQTSFLILSLTLITFTYGQLVIAYSNGLLINNLFQDIRILIWIILLFLTIKYNISYLISSMLKSINNDYLINRALSNTSFYISLLKYDYDNKTNHTLFINLNNSIESIYQTLNTYVNDKIGSDYRKYQKSLQEVLLSIMYGDNPKQENKINHLDHLYASSKDLATDFFETILENQVYLIKNLYDNDKDSEAIESIEDFFGLLNPPRNKPSLFKVYLRYTRLLISITNSNTLIKPMLNKTSNFSRENRDINVGPFLLKELLLKSAEDNDVLMVSKISYSLLNTFKKDEKKTSDNFTDGENIEYLVKIERSISTNIGNDEFIKPILFLLLQSLLKSIEQSSYASTGFLIKMLVTQLFREEYRIYIEETLYEFIQSSNMENPYIKEYYTSENEMLMDPDFNKETLKYCTYKLFILLYTQQIYAFKNKLPGQEEANENYHSFIPIVDSLKDCEYLDYLFIKIDKSKNEFGLVSIEDVSFFNEIKHNIKYKIMFDK